MYSLFIVSLALSCALHIFYVRMAECVLPMKMKYYFWVLRVFFSARLINWQKWNLLFIYLNETTHREIWRSRPHHFRGVVLMSSCWMCQMSEWGNIRNVPRLQCSLFCGNPSDFGQHLGCSVLGCAVCADIRSSERIWIRLPRILESKYNGPWPPLTILSYIHLLYTHYRLQSRSIIYKSKNKKFPIHR